DSSAVSVNNAGQVVGSSRTIKTSTIFNRRINDYPSTTTSAGFLWTSSSGLTSLGNIGPAGINSSGEIAGTSGSPTEASRWKGNTVVQLGILPGGTFSVAIGINDYGQVVGYSANDNSANHAFLWTPSSPNSTTGTMIDLGTLFSSPGGSYASAINSQ